MDFQTWKTLREQMRHRLDVIETAYPHFVSALEIDGAPFGSDPLTGAPIFTVEQADDKSKITSKALTGKMFEITVDRINVKVVVQYLNVVETYDAMDVLGATKPVFVTAFDDKPNEASPLSEHWNAFLKGAFS